MFSFHLRCATTRWSTQPWKQTTWHKLRKRIINEMKLMCLCVTNVYMISEFIKQSTFQKRRSRSNYWICSFAFSPSHSMLCLHLHCTCLDTPEPSCTLLLTPVLQKQLWVCCANQTAAAEPEGNPCWPAWTDKWAYGSRGRAALWVGPSCIRCPCWFLSSADSSCSVRTPLVFPHM